MEKSGIEFPFVVKPDFGERGREVEFIQDMKSLSLYFADKNQGKYLIQEYLEEGHEFGVFFTKDPKSNKANITSLTLKIPLQIVGDGHSDLKTLAISHPRVSRYFHEVTYPDIDRIPIKNQIVRLSQKGNHCKGAVFLDCTEYIDEEMISVFKNICAPFEGFFYGRLDVKVQDWGDLWNDQMVKILEVNGCNSEPIHIYSPESNYLKAVKVLKAHFSIMAGIAKFIMDKKKYHPNLSNLWTNYLNFRKSRKL